MAVGGVRFAAPESTCTLHLAQTPTAPQEFPSGTPARRATSSNDSSSLASARVPRGMNVTFLDEAFTGIWQPPTKLSAAGSVYYSMRTQVTTNDECRIAEEIVGVLPADIVRACSPEKNKIRYSVRADGMKLKTIVFSRESLRRLLADPLLAVKVEYLQRDLLESATQKKEFRYPRTHLHAKPSFPRRFALGLSMVSVI
jgi:hypothetical protein